MLVKLIQLFEVGLQTVGLILFKSATLTQIVFVYKMAFSSSSKQDWHDWRGPGLHSD